MLKYIDILRNQMNLLTLHLSNSYYKVNGKPNLIFFSFEFLYQNKIQKSRV